MTFIENVFSLLNTKTKYAVARNHKGLPHQYSSRDIDIIISKQDYKRILPALYETAKFHGYLPLLVHQSDRFDTTIWQREEDIIQFDFFFGSAGKGILFLTAEEITRNRLFDGHVYYLPEYLQFIDKFLFNTLCGKEYPNKYRSIREKAEAESPEKLSEVLHTVFGKKITTAKQVENLSVQKRFRMAWLQSFRRHFFLQMYQTFAYLKSQLRYIFSPRGMFISLTGPDGVGKTTVLEIVKSTYGKLWQGETLKEYHFRPEVLPRIAVLLHKAGAVKTVDENYTEPHRGKNSGAVGSLLRLFYHILDYQLGYLKVVRPRKFRREITIFDRYYYDIAIDPERCNISLPYALIFTLGVLVPHPDYPILLTAKENIILHRKSELTKSEIGKMQHVIRWAAQKYKRFILIENNTTAQEAAHVIMNEILARQSKKYAPYFSK